jgi:Kdo2-lipid IVA lauroyltransferase/acyltransferase
MNKEKYHFRDWPFLLLAGLLSLLSRLPLWMLYGLAYGLHCLFFNELFGYRRTLVLKNIQNSFPEKSQQEIKMIQKKFFIHLSQVIVEVIKLTTMRKSDLQNRVVYTPESMRILEKYYSEGKSIMIVLGHNCNWEWIGTCSPLWLRHPVLTAYRPLRNRVFDRFMNRMRSRAGCTMASMSELPREMIGRRKQVDATGLIADQTPSNSSNAYWVKFLNQETAFFKGPEYLSKKFNLSVFWASAIKTGKGRYSVNFELITDDPNSFAEGELTRLYASYLERDIRKKPETWLWSHRRWKHKRPEGMPLVE